MWVSTKASVHAIVPMLHGMWVSIKASVHAYVPMLPSMWVSTKMSVHAYVSILHAYKTICSMAGSNQEKSSNVEAEAGFFTSLHKFCCTSCVRHAWNVSP